MPGLYKPEELDPILSSLKDSASDAGFRGPMFAFFVHRVLSHLHVALVLDCSSQTFTVTCESNPAFYANSSLQWMRTWRADSMLQVCSRDGRHIRS